MIGKSFKLQIVRDLVTKFAQLDASVLIEGEAGTGKEMVACLIHTQSEQRKQGRFIPLNCSMLTESLFESQLFGYCKGSFTDAKTDYPGLINLAAEGTVFLGNIQALSTKSQLSLLHVLQERRYVPLGGADVLTANVRWIAATNTRLSRLVEQQRFSRELYEHLHTLHLTLPPLRDRQGDIKRLAEHFLTQFSEKLKSTPKTLHPDTLKWFELYSWPGNVRELQHLLQREVLACHGPVLRIDPPENLYKEHRLHQDKRRSIQHQPEFIGEYLESGVIAKVEQQVITNVLTMSQNTVALSIKSAKADEQSISMLNKK